MLPRTTPRWLALAALSVTTLVAGGASAEEPQPGKQIDLGLGEADFQLDETVVAAPKPKLDETPGSAQTVKQEQLEAMKYDDPHRVLSTVPGVYVRGEDGLGLRPNIGIRGASSDRSKKITLMEDGVLLGPAPYSAPAAYYFPLITRMNEMQIVKGPASIRFGPHTVGGAVNLVTTPFPRREPAGLADVALGQYGYGKFLARYAAPVRGLGYVLEGVHLRSDGFKEIDGGGNTGFRRNEWMMKTAWASNPARDTRHQVELKLGYSDEVSNETYLGLTDADFAANPYRRYLASKQDRMQWWRSQVAVTHRALLGESVDVTTTAYRNDFKRRWRKFNDLAGGIAGTGPNVFDVLGSPGTVTNRPFHDVLTGAADSVGTDAAAIVLGTNRREFVSEGVQSALHVRAATGAVAHQIEVGGRLHYDRIYRRHTAEAFDTVGGTLVPRGLPVGVDAVTADATGNATALSFHALDEIAYRKLLVVPGVRTELVWTGFRDRLTGADAHEFRPAILPGAGVFYTLTDELGLLAGVHRGFSPVTPGQPAGTKPEYSVAYEAGARHAGTRSRAEVVGFLNDYQNLTSECTFSTGCTDPNLGRQFNGGKVLVYGVEVSGGYRIPVTRGIDVPLDASYTLTVSEFRTSFLSSDPSWGAVEAGDRLPYVPIHQGSLHAGAISEYGGLDVVASYVGEMRDVAGQGSIPAGERIEPYVVLDLAGHVVPFRGAKVYLKVDNVFDDEYAISRRPFGLRPGKPRWASIGFAYTF